jgi:glycosyltransferase involved in cell wall biosynthesis
MTATVRTGQLTNSPRAGDAARPVEVALAHDYLAVRGGAERVFASMVRTVPDAPIYTSIYAPEKNWPEFADNLNIVPSWLSRVGVFRGNYRLAFPLLAPTISRTTIDADVLLCSSSGWSHGFATTGRKLVYCYNPARWLYQTSDYVRSGRKSWYVATHVMRPVLRGWDQRSAATADRYLAISSIVARRIADNYGFDAEVLPPPTTLDAGGPSSEVVGLSPGFVLSIGRLMSYKNVDRLIDAFRQLPDQELVIVGDGPFRQHLTALAGPNVRFLGHVDDATLRWLYANCAALAAASHEDFGLTPVEVGLFGKPSVTLRYGGFLDTQIEGVTGLHFDDLDATHIAGAIRDTLATTWSAPEIIASSMRYHEVGFADRLRTCINEVASLR